jgi:zinc protease
VRAARVDDAKALLRAALDKGPVEVTVVGDISVADAVKGLQATLGALPKHFAAPSQANGDEQLPPPRATPLSFTHQGGKDQAIAYIAWPTLGIESDAHQARTLKVLQLIMSRRLFDELRTQDGMTYTPSISSTNSLLTPGYGYLSVATEVPPTKVPAFYAAIDRSIAPLKEKEVSLDELQRARDPHIEDVVHEQQTNAYWLGVLKHSQADPRWLDLIRTTVPDLKAVTTADVLHAARTYLADEKAWKMVVLPEGFAMPAGGAE